MENTEQNNNNEYSVREVNETEVNGRVDFDNSAKNPLARNEVTYYNPSADKMQTQNYLVMQDLVVPVILRRKNGVLEFAMQYEYIPAINKVLLELPDCPFKDKKDIYTNGEVTTAVDDRMMSLGLEMIGFKNLDAKETAVSQSFTDQLVKFVAVYVDEEYENKQLQWFSASSLADYLKNIGENSSLQTKQALQLFYSQIYKNQLEEEQTLFEYDKSIVGKTIEDWEDTKNIMEHKYRFGIERSENEQPADDSVIPNYGQHVEYGLSKNSVQCLIIKKENGRIKIGLSKQQRSPFVARQEIDEYFYEAAAGMVEPGENIENAVAREVEEETGIKVDARRLFKNEESTILSKATQEYSDFYIYYLENDEKIGEQKLDDEEAISKIEWFDLDTTNFGEMNIPLPTKFMIEKLKYDYLPNKSIRKDRVRGSDDGSIEI